MIIIFNGVEDIHAEVVLEEVNAEGVVLARVRVALADVLFATVTGPTIRA